MDQKKINRINKLAKKERAEGLTEAEKAEQKALRREYINAYKASLIAQLENTYIIDETGHKRKLTELKRKH